MKSKFTAQLAAEKHARESFQDRLQELKHETRQTKRKLANVRRQLEEKSQKLEAESQLRAEAEQRDRNFRKRMSDVFQQETQPAKKGRWA
jgi:uncharacterized protein Yka (UPF0111/DUF47 family)